MTGRIIRKISLAVVAGSLAIGLLVAFEIFNMANPVQMLADSAIQSEDLGSIPANRWLRYHHLFQELLLAQLRARASPADISALRRRAATWYEEQGLFDEALGQLLETDDPSEAAQLVVRQRSWITEREQWHRLDVWLRRLPARLIEDSPELLMLQAGLAMEKDLLSKRIEHYENLRRD